MENSALVTVAAHPFRIERELVHMPAGLTIQQMLEAAQPDPVLRQHAVAFIQGELIPREMWSRVRPKPGVHIEIRVLPMGGGGKNPLRTILTIAVIAAAAAVSGGLAGGIFGTSLLAAGSFSAIFAGSLIGFGGMLLVNAVAPVRPPKAPSLSKDQRDSPTLFIEGARNDARPFAPVPQVLGRHRIAPPFGTQPYTEVVGDNQFIRMLFVWGIGPLAIDSSSLKIGETLLTDFEGVRVEHREGYAADAPLTLITGTVNQEDLTLLLDQASGWQERTAGSDADELSIDVTFPQGLVNFDKKGRRKPQTVAIRINYREVGSGTWLTPTFTDTTVPDSWVSGDTVTFTHKKTAAVRHGLRWSVAARGQYEVRIQRTTADTDSNQIYDVVNWTALRSITNEDPINSIIPVAKTALVIKATDQLNQIVDTFNGIVTTKGKKWNGSAWVDDQEITSPADLFRHVLQGNAMAAPLADARIDLTRLQSWKTFCNARNFKFNMVRDFQSSVWDTLADVAGAGRAAPAQVDGKWSVVVEEPQPVPVSHITPRNSSDFRMEKAFVDQPEGWRIAFLNEDQDYRQDEYRVFRDGHSSLTARKYETLSLPGVTNADQVYQLGRFRIAQGILQPERWTFQQDMEYLTYARGDRIAVTHDVLLVGLHYGRIKSVTVDGSNNVTELTLDEPVEMVTAETYGIAIRTILGGEITTQVALDPGEVTTITLTTPIPATGGQPTVEAGDIFGFGYLGAETDDASVIAIEPDSDFKARISCVPYRAGIFTADSETLPTFSTNLTPLPSIPTVVVTGTISDESMLARGPGESLRARIGIEFNPISDPRLDGARVEVQMRPTSTGEPYFNAPIDSQSSSDVIVSGVRTGETWDLRIRFVMNGRLQPGAWTAINNHTVIGKSTAPAPLSGLTVSAFGGQAFLRWDEPDELDVLFGGVVYFRHSPLFTGALWQQSSSIGEAARARDLIATLPLKGGTYLARVFDVAGERSTVSTITTKQASVLTFAAADSLDEAPLFGGVHTNTVAAGSSLKLVSATDVDSIADIDAVTDWDSEGGIIESGTYEFEFGFDFATVTKVRLTTRVTMLSENVLDSFDEREGTIDEWESFDGADQAETDIIVEVRHTDDDPASPSASFSAWERLDSAEFEARGFEFRALLTSNDPAFNILVSELGIDAEEL